MRAVTRIGDKPDDPPTLRRKLVHHKGDVQVAAFGHDAGAADKRHEDHEKDGKLLREGKGEVGQVAHHDVGEGDEPQQPDGNSRQILLDFKGNSGLGAFHGGSRCAGFAFHGFQLRDVG